MITTIRDDSYSNDAETSNIGEDNQWARQIAAENVQKETK